MTRSFHALALATAALCSTGAFAQSDSTVTREQVRAELARLESAGYNPLSNCTGKCPDSLQHAQAVLDGQPRAHAAAAHDPLLAASGKAGS